MWWFGMDGMDNALVKRNTGADCKYENGNCKTPEIDFLSMAEWETAAAGPARSANSVQEQDLIAGVYKRVYAFGEHGGTACNCCGCKFGNSDKCVACQGCVDDFF